MAMQHFNARDASVVPSLDNNSALLQNCPVRFNVTDSLVYDSGLSPLLVASDLIATSNEPICAVLGPMDPDSSAYTSLWTANLDVPQLSYTNPDPEVLQSSSTTLGMSLSYMDHALAIVEYLQHPIVHHAAERDAKFENIRSLDEEGVSKHGVPRDYLVVLHSPRYGGLARQVARVAPTHQLHVHTVEYVDQAPPNVTLDQHRDALLRNQLWGPGYHTFLLAMDRPGQVVDEAERLDRLGLLARENLYMFYSTELRADNLMTLFPQVLPGSATDRLLSGAAVLTDMDGFMVPSREVLSEGSDDENDEDAEPLVQYFDGAGPFLSTVNETDANPFLKSWFAQDASVVDQLNQNNPLNASAAEYFVAPPNYFQTHLPAPYSSYVYDAVIATGLGKCHEWHQEQSTGTSPHHDDGGGVAVNVNVHNPHVIGIVQSEFEGASGRFRMHAGNKGRHRDGVELGVLNIRPDGIHENGFRRYRMRLTSIANHSLLHHAHHNEDEGQWIEVEDFIYRDGGDVAPTNVRTIWEKNYLSEWCRDVGWALLSVALFFSVGSAVIVILYRKHKVMRAGQPFFLLMLCFGSLMSSLAIVTLSFDESHGWSIDQLTAACMSTVWLFFTGNIIFYCGLFSKLWRIDRVMQLRRKSVTVLNVLGPMVIVLAFAVAVLTTWTFVDPWIWERELVMEIPSESFGHCESDTFDTFFLSMVLLMIIVTSMTTYVAWKASDIPDEFSDTKLVLYTVSSHLQAWIVGPPTLAVLGSHASANGTYFGRVFLIWVFAVSGVMVVIGPKVVAVLFEQRVKKTSSRVRISGWDREQATMEEHRKSMITSNISQLGASSSTNNHWRGSTSSVAFNSSHFRQKSSLNDSEAVPEAEDGSRRRSEPKEIEEERGGGGSDSEEQKAEEEDPGAEVSLRVADLAAAIEEERRAGLAG